MEAAEVKPKVVHVTWRDSAAYEGWTPYDGDKTCHAVESIGYLVAETSEHLAIAGSHDGGSANPWCQLLVIPKEAIVTKRVVRNA